MVIDAALSTAAAPSSLCSMSDNLFATTALFLFSGALVGLIPAGFEPTGEWSWSSPPKAADERELLRSVLTSQAQLTQLCGRALDAADARSVGRLSGVLRLASGVAVTLVWVVRREPPASGKAEAYAAIHHATRVRVRTRALLAEVS